jgi:hypothetical protein
LSGAHQQADSAGIAWLVRKSFNFFDVVPNVSVLDFLRQIKNSARFFCLKKICAVLE